jgi:hypothetical protein
MVIELNTSTSLSSPCPGTPFAAELDAKLVSDEALSSIVAWWRSKYREWRPTLDAEGVEGIGPISDREMTVFCVCGPEDSPDSDIQAGWGYLREERREALRGVQALA